MSDTRTAIVHDPSLAFESIASDQQLLLVGHSPAFERVRTELSLVAGLQVSVLVRGESGSGRSLLAATVHRDSGRSRAPMMVIPCDELPDTLLEIELFGCVKGSVVGASSDRHGVLDLCHGGTVVLEDIEMMTLRTQGLLVRFLETGDINRVGTFGSATPADARLVATTSADLSDLVAKGLFREELWSRLHAIDVPPLRERREDIPVLVDYFGKVHQAAIGRSAVGFTPDALAALMEFSWPGNVRELRRVIERLVNSADTQVVADQDLPVGIRRRGRGKARPGAGRRLGVSEELFTRIIADGESFWSYVYPLFMEREITRTDVRDLVRRGLEVAGGSSETLARLFNMPPSDHRRFVRFLRKYDCQPTP